MRFYKTLFIFILLMALALPSGAGEEKSELTLYKEPLYDFVTPQHSGGLCEGVYRLSGGRDNPDLRRDFNYYLCEGKYTLALEGPKGKTVTLFAGFNYDKSRGYLVLRKLDDKNIWILDLMNHPSGQWTKIPEWTDMGVEYGGYEVFYQAAPLFEQNVSSMKWGQWWEGENP